MKKKHSEQITELNDITNINQLQQLVQSLINEGKNLKNKKELKKSQFDLWKQKIQQEKKNQEREKEILEEKVKDLDKRILEEKKELTDFSSNIDKQASFQCEKIDSQCPFIKVINKQTFDNLESQKLKISNRIAELEDSRKKLLEEITDKSEKSDKGQINENYNVETGSLPSQE